MNLQLKCYFHLNIWIWNLDAPQRCTGRQLKALEANWSEYMKWNGFIENVRSCAGARWLCTPGKRKGGIWDVWQRWRLTSALWEMARGAGEWLTEGLQQKCPEDAGQSTRMDVTAPLALAKIQKCWTGSVRHFCDPPDYLASYLLTSQDGIWHAYMTLLLITIKFLCHLLHSCIITGMIFKLPSSCINDLIFPRLLSPSQGHSNWAVMLFFWVFLVSTSS